LNSQLVKLIVDLTGFEGTIRWDPNTPNGQPRRCLDTRLAVELLGWSAESSLSDGLSRTIDAFREMMKAPVSTATAQ
jgi:GDP-L-fucose synthase